MACWHTRGNPRRCAHDFALAAVPRTEGSDSDQDWVWFGAAVVGGLGAGIGVGIDALIRKEYLVYQRPAPPPTQVRLVPMLTPKRQGLAVSVSF